MKKDFPTFLKTIYHERLKNNSRYSMRAFALGLSVDQSLLTKIINGKRSPSDALIERVGRELKLDSQAISQYKEAEKILKKSQTDDEYRRIQDLDFEIISEWYHFAILELLLVNGFVAKPNIIAKSINISVEDAKKAVARLLSRGLIEQHGETLRVTSRHNTWATNEKTTAARKSLQKDLLEKAKNSIDVVPFPLRENGSLTLAFNSSKIDKVKKLIQGFKNQILAYSEKEGNYDEVYQLVVGFFPLSKLAEKTSKGKI